MSISGPEASLPVLISSQEHRFWHRQMLEHAHVNGVCALCGRRRCTRYISALAVLINAGLLGEPLQHS